VERAPDRRRRLLSWLPSALLLVLIAGFALAAIGVNNSWWVQPNPTPATDQTAPNGSSLFTGAGVDYFGRTGLVVIRMDAERLPAEELGLQSEGDQLFSSERPLLVQVVGPDGALAVEGANRIAIHTEFDEVTAVDVFQTVPGGFVRATATLADVAALYGWSAEELETLPERFGDARRADPVNPTSITVGPGTNVGLAVSATLTVHGGTTLTYRAERLP
jgi:hypothetical protein